MFHSLILYFHASVEWMAPNLNVHPLRHTNHLANQFIAMWYTPQAKQLPVYEHTFLYIIMILNKKKLCVNFKVKLRTFNGMMPAIVFFAIQTLISLLQDVQLERKQWYPLKLALANSKDLWAFWLPFWSLLA